MAQSYTPGLKVVERTAVRKRRVLPIKGEVLVESGARTEARQVIARTELPGDVYPVNVANLLGVSPREVAAAMLAKVGEKVRPDRPMARAKSFFGLFRNEVKPPIEAVVENISSITGQVILRGKPLPVEVKAYLPGSVVRVFPSEGVEVECNAAFIQGIFGIGGEAFGPLAVPVASPGDILEVDCILENHRNRILVGGSLVTAEALRKAESLGVSGIVVGGFDDRDLRDYLGYDLGVAITGGESIGISLIVTEGFGRIDMAAKTFELLKKHEGREVSINGATQIRAGVIRPEVVIPLGDETAGSTENAGDSGTGLAVGRQIRCIRRPYFGRIGRVAALPSELREMDSGARVRVLDVAFENGETACLPRANIEIIEGG